MDVTLIKKCAACSVDETITFDNIEDIHMVFYKNKYYHRDCFIQMCDKRVARNDRYSLSYKDALLHVDIFEKEAMGRINRRLYQDTFNGYLLYHYDIMTVSSHFWQVIADIEAGSYKGKSCHKISLKTIYKTWDYYQRELDNIAIKNKGNHKGPKDDSDRLNYDLAIILKKVPEYRKIIMKEKAEQEIEKLQKEKVNKINYENLHVHNNENKKAKDDIMDMVNDIF